MSITRPARRATIAASLVCASVFAGRLVAASATGPAAQTRGLGAKNNPIKPILDGMQDAQGRLSRGDAGLETRAIQQRVVDDLQKAIDAAKNQSGSSRSSDSRSQDKSSQGGGSGDRPVREGNQESQAAGGRAPGSRSAKRPGERKPAVAEKSASATAIRRTLLQDVWGHLPPALRERVPADFGETVLPAYDELVRRYFEALRDDSSAAKSPRR